MKQHLFSKVDVSVHKNEAVKRAIEKVRTLPDSQIVQPNLAGVLDRIAEGLLLTVATLEPKRKTGKRQTRQTTDLDYGQERMKEVDWLAISIPFTGAMKSFGLRPTRSVEVRDAVDVDESRVTVTFPDDSELERKLDAFIEAVSRNLDQLRTDLASLREQIMGATSHTVEERRAAIKARQERDQTRDFPIS